MEIQVQTQSRAKKMALEKFGKKYAELLNIDKRSATVYISLKRDVGSEMESEGLTVALGNDYFIYIQSSMNLLDMLRTLAHEMVHVKQLIRGQLQHRYNRGKFDSYWCGRKSKKQYLDQPWEIEAFTKEALLFRRAVQILTED